MEPSLRTKHQIAFKILKTAVYLFRLELCHNSEVNHCEGVRVSLGGTWSCPLHADILRFEVSVHIAVGVQDFEGFQNLSEHRVGNLLQLRGWVQFEELGVVYHLLEVIAHVEHFDFGDAVCEFVAEHKREACQPLKSVGTFNLTRTRLIDLLNFDFW